MIQRLQTIYLLFAALLTGSLLFAPYAEIISENGEVYLFDSGGFFIVGTQNPKLLFGSFPIVLLSLISVIFVLVTILLYKHRSRQILFSRLIIVILSALSVIIFYDLWRCIQLIPGNHALKIFLVFPLIAIILIYLAIKAIEKDEKLLKSANRIR